METRSRNSRIFSTSSGAFQTRATAHIPSSTSSSDIVHFVLFLIPAYNALAGCAKGADRGGGLSFAAPDIMGVKSHRPNFNTQSHKAFTDLIFNKGDLSLMANYSLCKFDIQHNKSDINMLYCNSMYDSVADVPESC